MAQLNFPDPNTTQTYTEAGITWTWNATLGVWSSEPGSADDALTEIQADSLYLSKVNNDTAAGEITFESKGLFETGLYIQSKDDFPGVDNGYGGAHFDVVPNGVTLSIAKTDGTALNVSRSNNGAIQTWRNGGNEVGKIELNLSGETTAHFGNFSTLSDEPNYFAGSTQHDGGVRVTGGNFRYNTTETSGIAFRVTADTTASALSGIRSSGNYSGTVDSYFSFFAENETSTGNATYTHGYYVSNDFTDSGDTNYGVLSNVSAGSNTNYNFYAQGTAPNFFEGQTWCKGGVVSGTDGVSGRFVELTSGANPKINWKSTVSSARDILTATNATGDIFAIVSESTSCILKSLNGATLKLEGLAGGPLLRNGFDLDSTGGIVDAVKNVVDRINALEANEIIDDATDTSLLQLLANASARLDSIEARLTALEGAN